MRAAVLLISGFVTRLKKVGCTGGRIVNLSTDAEQTFPTQITYGASKSAMEAYTRSIAVEVGKYGVTINTVTPSLVPTGGPPYITLEEPERLSKEEIPLRRVGPGPQTSQTRLCFWSLARRHGSLDGEPKWMAGTRLAHCKGVPLVGRKPTQLPIRFHSL